MFLCFPFFVYKGIKCTVSEDECRTPSKDYYGNEVYLTGQNLT